MQRQRQQRLKGGGGGGGGGEVGVAALLLLGSCALLAHADSSSGKMSGPYEIVLEKLERCEDEGKGLIQFKYKMTRANRTHYALDISWMLNITFSDNLKAIINIQRWRSIGGWNPNAFHHISTKPCSECIQYGKQNFKQFLSLAGLPVKCPIEKGHYRTSGLILENSLTEFPEMPYGKYKLTVTYYKGLTKIGCYATIFHFKEK
ncbi:hypothetical protein R5R35_001278 [Gryllus longicercus]|uniref:MD-2-related lipid-recognition domain-containing protein n=1 Tax=Gryllus longicercus TaxID=2509291 RepID=A0AAN9VPL7_9ORTH